MLVPCNEWCELMRQYRSAAKAHGEIVSGLGDQPGVQFNLIWQEAENARRISDQVRAALLQHEHLHDCVAGPVESDSAGVTPATASKSLTNLQQRLRVLASPKGGQQHLCELTPMS
jgi:hypothetical protein